MIYNVKQIVAAGDIHIMETIDEDYNHFIRYSADEWSVKIDDAEEEVGNPEHLEKMFQANIEFITIR